MAVAAITKLGGEFRIAPDRRPVPVPGRGEVLIAVHAAGVNGHDVHQLHSGGHAMPGETDLPGLEVAGQVMAPGADVTRWRIGDRVCA